jgi:hypothetical protein
MVKGLSVDEFKNLTPQQSGGLSPEQFMSLGSAKAKQPEVAAGLIGKLGQGATFGLADEMQAGLFALPRYIGNEIRGQEDASLGGAYDQLLGEQRANLQAAQEQYPIASTGLEVAGAIGTGVAGAGTKLGKFVGGKIAQGIAPAAVSTAGKLGNLASRAAIGAGAAGTSGALYGAGSGEGEQGRLQSAKDFGMVGAAIGGALPIAGAGLGAVGAAALPKIDEGLREVGRLAQKYKIPLSVEQLSDSRALKNIQKLSQEAPLSGQAGFRDKQLTAWNKAVIQTFGGEGDKFTPELADKAFNRLGMQFDALGKGKVVDGNAFYKNINDNILKDTDYKGMSKEAVDGFNNYLQEKVLPNIQNNQIKGEALSKIRADVNKLGRETLNVDSKILYRDLENEIIESLTQGSGKKAFSKTKQQYKNLLAVEPLFTKEKGGIVSPSLLTGRVNKIYKRAATRGKAGELGDLARVGRSILGEAGGSDSTQKIAYLAALTTGGINPASIPAIVGGLGANRLFQELYNRNPALINKLLNGGKATAKDLKGLKPSEINEVMKATKRVEPTITAVSRNPEYNLKNTK